MILSIGGVLRPAEIAVTDPDMHVTIFQSLQGTFCLATERSDDLDGKYFFDQRTEYGSLIAASGADFQYSVQRLWVECTGHKGHDKRR